MNKLGIMQEVLELESRALKLASDRLDGEAVNKLVDVFEKLINVGGSLIFCGVGKSGHIAVKLASTFASLGLPSWFLHPTEALHGDLGRIRKNDAIVFLSKSGTTEEILKLIPYLDIPSDMLIGLVGKKDSPVSDAVSIVLDCSVEKEACVNNQAPTTSSTLALGMGDAMAVLYEHIVGLSKEGFAVNHPGGLLGKSMHLKVSHLMWNPDEVPVARKDSPLKDIILSMTKYNVGACAILGDGDLLEGIIVEGDIRRTFANSESGLETKASEIMNASPVTISSEHLAYDALKLMETKGKQIYVLPVVNESKKFLGFIRMHDLLKEGFIVS